MSDTHPLAAMRDSLCKSGDRLVETVEGLNAAQLNWHPTADAANSIFAIVTHALSAQERLILGQIFKQETEPRAPQPFEVQGDATQLVERWNRLRPRIESTLSRASTAALYQECEHPRLGKLTGWEMLFLMDRHTAEHVGHVELTRDLAKAAGI